VPEINLKSLESAILEVSKCGLKVKIKLNNQDHTRDQAILVLRITLLAAILAGSDHYQILSSMENYMRLQVYKRRDQDRHYHKGNT
jgi:hypothetical protein